MTMLSSDSRTMGGPDARKRILLAYLAAMGGVCRALCTRAAAGSSEQVACLDGKPNTAKCVEHRCLSRTSETWSQWSVGCHCQPCARLWRPVSARASMRMHDEATSCPTD
jgi:hypothetical protein